MKKLLAIILAALMLCSTTATAFAADEGFDGNAEKAVAVLKSSGYNLSTATLEKYGETDGMSVLKFTDTSTEMTVFNIFIGNYLFDSREQQVGYDLGIYIVQDNKPFTLEKAYTDGVIDDEDMDSVMEITGMSGTRWEARKLSEVEQAFVRCVAKYEQIEYGRYPGHTGFPYAVSEIGEYDGYKVLSSGKRVGEAVESYGNYEIKSVYDDKTAPLGIYLYKDNAVTAFEQAWNDGAVNEDNIGGFVKILQNETKLSIKDTGSVLCSDKFIKSANAYVHNTNVKYTEDNIADYITVYDEFKDTAEFFQRTIAVFGVKTNDKGNYRELVDGYVFTSDYLMKGYNSGLFVYREEYPGSRIVPISTAVYYGWISAEELAEVIPKTVKLSGGDILKIFKASGYDMTDVILLSDNFCYAYNRDISSPDADLDFSIKDFDFHMDSRLAPNALGLFKITLDGVTPVYEESRDYQFFDILRAVKAVRKAELGNVKFHFTVENHFGEQAEKYISLINSSRMNDMYWLTAFGKIRDCTVCMCRRNLHGMTEFGQRIGKYLYTSGGPYEMDDIGIFVFRDGSDDNLYYTLQGAYKAGIITDDDADELVGITGTSGDNWRIYELSEVEVDYLKYLEGMNRICLSPAATFRKLGTVGDYTLYSEKDYFTERGRVNYFGYEVRYNGGSGSLGIVLYKDGKFITAEQALDNGIINESNVKAFVDVMEKAERVTVIDTRDEYSELKTALMKNYKTIEKYSDIVITKYEPLKNGMILFNYDLKESTRDCMMRYTPIGKYLLTEGSGADDEYIYIAPDTITNVKNAYESKLIGSAVLDEIASKLRNMSVNKLSLKPGEESGYFNPRDKIIKTVSSDTKVARITNGYYVTALRKGTAKITYTYANGAKATCNVTVKSDPKLTKNGKTVKSVAVKKGKTVKVRIVGKASAVRNVYENTKYAKVTSSAKESVIKIKGLKRTAGTTLKIKVNGLALKLKVKVK